MTEIDTHIEKQIPFVLFSTKEGEWKELWEFFPAERRVTYADCDAPLLVSATCKTENCFNNLLVEIKNKAENFQSLRPTK